MRTFLKRAMLVLFAAAWSALPGGWLQTSPAAAADCQFVLGFKALHDMIAGIVGDCLVDEHHNPENGDALQETTGVAGKGGLLVWRKADNWTAYTDGYRTWVDGPNGLQQRLNTERFPWEKDLPAATPQSLASWPRTPVEAAALFAATADRWEVSVDGGWHLKEAGESTVIIPSGFLAEGYVDTKLGKNPDCFVFTLPMAVQGATVWPQLATLENARALQKMMAIPIWDDGLQHPCRILIP